ncbi:MAG: dihydropteroate synthase, partial [Candidatus Aenigmatarchaeota archaeon]
SDAAINRDALIKNINTDVVIFGSLAQLLSLCEKLKKQPFNLKEVSQKLYLCLENLFKEKFVFKAKDKFLNIKEPIICGIVNLTFDSFSGDGLLAKASGSKLKQLVLEKIEKMIKDGAKIIDIGAESTRPFSKPIKENDEIKRLIPILKVVRKEFKKIAISIDTYKFNVAKTAIEEGVDIVNDITALRKSPQLAKLIKKHKLGCVLMHMKGMPSTMQIAPSYKNVVEEIIDFFKERLEFCKKEGINYEQILIDPGIGFGKQLEHNLRIVNELYKFKIFGLPIFLGLSRKSFIGKILNLEVNERLIGTIASTIVAILKGANILRVHDVKETKQAIKMAYEILKS